MMIDAFGPGLPRMSLPRAVSVVWPIGNAISDPNPAQN